ncbi:MAG: DnaJ domain-containing protein [Bacteroidia bacterium]|nr:DnaJ domain-containing protein [Bacteroidia bacterium]MBP9688583.1 DnaJ domain-containing protein [Bacteroidia bacterium]
MAFKNYYDILGIESDADASEIKEAFRVLTAKYSSATNQRDEFSQQMLVNLSEAVEVLANPAKRKEYDQTRILLDDNVKLALVHGDIKQQDAVRITESIKKHFEQVKLLNAKEQALLIAQNTKPKVSFSSIKIIFCLLIVSSTLYYYHPEYFEFLKGTPVSEQRSYEWYTNDAAVIYSQAKAKSKVLHKVPRGTGFNGISETVYYIKVAFTDSKGKSRSGYINKKLLQKKEVDIGSVLEGGY